MRKTVSQPEQIEADLVAGDQHTPVTLLVADLDIRVIATQTGELLRHLTLNPTATTNPKTIPEKPHAGSHLAQDLQITPSHPRLFNPAEIARIERSGEGLEKDIEGAEATEEASRRASRAGGAGVLVSLSAHGHFLCVRARRSLVVERHPTRGAAHGGRSVGLRGRLRT